MGFRYHGFGFGGFEGYKDTGLGFRVRPTSPSTEYALRHRTSYEPNDRTGALSGYTLHTLDVGFSVNKAQVVPDCMIWDVSSSLYHICVVCSTCLEQYAC